MKYSLLFLGLLSLLVGPSLRAQLPEAEELLRGKQYAEAAAKLAAVPAEQKADGYADWLRAVALYHSGKQTEAIVAADAVPENSRWFRKARLLKARSLADLKKHAEAETIYAAEATRALASARKDELAGLLVAFGDEVGREPAAGEIDAPAADVARAAKLYQQALEVDFLTPKFQDETMFKLAVAYQKLNQHQNALRLLNDYLIQFDKSWQPISLSNSTSNGLNNGLQQGAQGDAGPRLEKPRDAKRFLQAGVHVVEARLLLAESQLALRQFAEARKSGEALLALQPAPDAATVAAVAWLRCRTFGEDKPIVQTTNNAPQPDMPPNDRMKHNEALRALLAAHPAHLHAPEAARLIAENLLSLGQTDQGLVALEDFISGKGYQFDEAAEANRKPDAASGLTPTEQLARQKQSAFFRVAQLNFDRKKFDAAIKQWQEYTVKFPNGAQWAAAQQGIIDGEFQLGLAAVAAGDEKLARERFDAFLTRYPLDGRARQILFIYGQFPYAEAQTQELALRAKDAAAALPAATLDLFRAAMDQWSRLITKYPQTEESSLALYNTALILTDKLDRLEEGLATFRRLTWGQWAKAAKERVAILEEKSLAISAPRVFRTNEVPQLVVSVRNIKKLKVSRYALDLEGWLRSAHRLGGLEKLDVDLIAPEKTWEVEVPNYAQWRSIQQQIPLPFPDNAGGACVVRVEGDDWQATTLVVRSDIEIISQATRGEMLVFALNARENKPEAGATVLLSDGAKLIGTGVTGEDGVFRQTSEALPNTTRAFVLTPHGAMVSGLDLTALTTVKQPKSATHTTFDRNEYFPGLTAKFVIVRHNLAGPKLSPAAGKVTLRILAPDDRLVLARPVEWAADGSIQSSFNIPRTAPAGEYKVQLLDKDDKIFVRAPFNVTETPATSEPQLALKLDTTMVLCGGKIQATLLADWPWGLPIGDEPVEITFANGKTERKQTDATGVLQFEITTAVEKADVYREENVTVRLPRHNATVQGNFTLTNLEWGMRFQPVPALVAAGTVVPVKIHTQTYDRKPVSKTVKAMLYRLSAPSPSRVLEGVPWVSYSAPQAAEETVSEFTLTTEAASGDDTHELKELTYGHYGIHFRDEAGKLLETQRFFVSGKEDPHSLRIFTSSNSVDAGSVLKLNLQALKPFTHVLLTVNSDHFLSHQIMTVPAGMTEIPITVSPEHAPNFRVTATAMDGRLLAAASHAFTVASGLQLTLKPGAKPEDEPTVEVKDRAGKPVKATLVSGLVKTSPDPDAFTLASNNIYPVAFPMQKPRDLRLAVHTSVALMFPGTTVKVNAATGSSGETKEVAMNDQQRLLNVQALELGNNTSNSLLALNNGKFASMNCFVQGANPLGMRSGSLLFSEGVQRAIDTFIQGATLPAIPDATETSVYFFFGVPAAAPLTQRAGLFLSSTPQPAQQRTITLPDLQMISQGEPEADQNSPQYDKGSTDSFGVAEQWRVGSGTDLKLTNLPDGQWLALVRAWTAEHGLVEARLPMVQRHALGLTVVKPTALTTGKELAVVVLTNRDHLEGETMLIGEGMTRGKTQIQLEKSQARKLVLMEIEEARGQASVLAETLAGQRLGRWQAPLGATSGWRNTRPSYSSLIPQEMVIAGGMATEADEIEMTIDNVRDEPMQLTTGSIAGTPTEFLTNLLLQSNNHKAASELLARITLLKRLRAGTEDQRKQSESLVSRCEDLVSELALQEVDGGWAWDGLDISPDILTTAQTWWAMHAAKQAGIVVSPKLQARVERFLETNYAGIPAEDYEKKAAVLHAMAAVGKADYANAAPMLRLRDSLSDASLALLTAALIRMERPDEAKQLLQLLEQHAEQGKVGTKIATASWKGSDRVVRLSERELITSMVLWSYAKLQPEAKLGAGAANWLLGSRIVASFNQSLSVGPAVVALDAWFQGANDWQEPGFVQVGGKSGVFDKDKHQRFFDLTASAGTNKFSIAPEGGKRGIFTMVLAGIPKEITDPKPWAHPEISSRKYFHDTLLQGDNSLNSPSTSPVEKVELGQRVRVEVKLKSTAEDVAKHPQYLVWDEPIPSCFALVPGSLEGNWNKLELLPGHIRLTYGPGVIQPLKYELVAVVPGESTAGASIISDAYDPTKFRPGTAAKLTVLAPGEKSPDVYVMNQAEHFELAKLTFDGGNSEECLKHLEALAPSARKTEYEKDLARMKLWLLTDRADGDAAQIVSAFETLNERHPSLVIPFDRILRVGAAYQKIGEHERGAYVFSAALDANFLTDARISAALEDNGDYAGSVDFQERLWFDAPDSDDPRSAYFALSQGLFRKANEAEKIAVRRGQQKLEKNGLLTRSRDLLRRFITLYPADALADDATFSLTNAYFALKDYPSVVTAAEAAVKRYPQSTYLGQFQYMAALGHFWQFHFAEALASSAPVANGESKDRDLARYITGQIHHAQGKPADAVSWYQQVKAKYPDAAAALAAFEEKKIGLPEIATYQPGEAVKLNINHRNVKQASLQIYKVDLMKLYLREKNLSRVTRVNLAGIAPEATVPMDVANAAAWTDHTLEVALPMKDEGAYLVIARGDDLFTSGLVLITALKLDVREDANAGSVRVNVLSAADGKYVADAEVKAIASGSAEIQSGQTDPRGIFQAGNLQGTATVIVRQGENRFAFHRGNTVLKPSAFPVTPATPRPNVQVIREFDPNKNQEFDAPQIPQTNGVLGKDAYLQNVDKDNGAIQDKNWGEWDSKRRTSGKGVQAEKALKK